MSHERIHLERLLGRARQESPPTVDVAGQVVRKIAARSPEPRNDWSLWGAAALSVAAASVVLVLTFQQGDFFNDPLAQWLQPLVVVMQ